MGKIFDALEKAKKESPVPDPEKRGHRAAKKELPERPGPPLETLKPCDDIRDMDKNMIAFLKPQSFEAEQFKILRTKLLFPQSGKPARIIMITSALPGEGKSFVAVNLAVSIAQGLHEHVLIVDCDMRMPSIHQRFGFSNVPGLSEYLSDGKPLSSFLLKTRIEKLSILPGGTPPHNPSELLASRQMSNLLQEVKERYNDRYIIIDSPPPKLTAETHTLSRQVDGILLVVKYRSTPRKMVSDVIEIVGKEKILGVILNRVDIRLPAYLGYHGYGKYMKEGRYHTKYHK